ncbi:MAG TPA: hypothetical protein VGJ60_07600 [Chloroflexota bacterium]|jgi:hypothetical protein
MPNYFAEFNSTPANIVADMKARILNSSNWANISGGTGNVMQAVTSRGAQMNVDLADAAATAQRMQLGVYRSYSAGSGTDKLTRYLCWHSVTGATTDTIHAMVSAGQDHLLMSIEGPRAGETNADSASLGSMRQVFFLGDVVPYFAGEPNPIVVLIANPTATTQMDVDTCWVSRNRADTASWVTAKLATLSMPNGGSQAGAAWLNPQRACLVDGNNYLWPYVVIEDAAGIRGRIGKCFSAGFAMSLWNASSANDFPAPIYGRLVYNAENYILVLVTRHTVSAQQVRTPFGWGSTANTNNYPVLAVPTQ